MTEVSMKVNVPLPSWFDAQFFIDSYLDKISGITPEDAYDEYTRRSTEDEVFSSAQDYIHKHSQGLPASLKSHVDKIQQSFDWRGYSKRNLDLLRLKPIDLVKHFLEHGIFEPRHWNVKSSLLDRRFFWAAHSGNTGHLNYRVQAVVHCFHFDVLCYLLTYLRVMARLGAEVHIFVANENISTLAMDDVVQSLRTGVKMHSWQRVHNYGEDWSSFHEAFRKGLFDDEGVTIKLQTKKSTNLGPDGGRAWIDEALSPVCGTYAAISSLLKSSTGDRTTVWASRLTASTGFGANEPLILEFLQRVGLCDAEPWRLKPFAAGSMFAARNSLFKEFYHDLGEVDYSRQYSKLPYCGRFAGHALERIFFYYCYSRGGANSVDWLD